MPRKPPPLPRSDYSRRMSAIALWLAILSLLTVPVTGVHLLGFLLLVGSAWFFPVVILGASMALSALAFGLLARRPLVPCLLALPSLLVQGPFAAFLLTVSHLLNTGMTPLHMAVVDEDVDKVKTLLANEAMAKRVNDRVKPRNGGDWDGQTALTIAVATDQPDMVRLLLDAGAEQPIEACNRDCSLRGSLVMLAAHHNSTAMLDMLIAEGPGGPDVYSKYALWEALDNRVASTTRAADDPQRGRALADNDRILATLLTRGRDLRQRVLDDCGRLDKNEEPQWRHLADIPGTVRADLCARARAAEQDRPR